MKKTIKVLLTILLASVCFVPKTLFAEENNSNSELRLALETMESYLQVRGWGNFEPTNPEPLYDADLVKYGYVFELHNGEQEGYGIVVEHGNGYIFAEGSIETASPYKGVTDASKNVYISALGYYSVNENARSLENFVSLRTNETLSREDFLCTRLEVEEYPLTTAQLSRAAKVIVKLNSYSSNFVSVVQPNGSACIPTSAIMALKYLSNVGRLTLYGSDMTELATNLHLAMDSGKGFVSDAEAKSGMNTWTSNTANCSRFITLSSTYTYTPTVANWNTIQTSIDSDKPAIAMFKANTIGYNTSHATTMVGYQLASNSTSGTSTNYAIVKDPGTSGCPERTIAWTVSNVYGYFILGQI